MNIKVKLYDYCLHFVEQRVSTARKAMEEAQESANEESKSSAGDKYETGRAVMQLEREKNAHQLDEALKLQRILAHIEPSKVNDYIELGSLAMTNQGNFYMAISAGKITIDNEEYYALSPDSPLGQALRGLRKNESALFNKNTFLVKEIM